MGSEDVIVQDLVETREYFTDETKHEYFVIYEKFANSDCYCEQKGRVKEIECDEEEIIQVLHGDLDCSRSLRNIQTYHVGKEFKTIEDILAAIEKEHKEIFK